MIEVSGGRRGFFSNIIWYLVHCHVAEKNNDEIIFHEFSPHYCDDISTGFYQFYLTYILNNEKYHKNFDYIQNIEDIRFFGNTQICGFILDVEIRKYMNFLIKKYLKIKPHLLFKIVRHSKEFEDKKVLGVHIRQTDLYTSHLDNKLDKPLSIDTYINEIEKNISDYDMLYLMSDNISSINKIKEHFNGFEIYNVSDVTINENEIDLPMFRKDNNDKYKLGRDVLIETELLSKCDKIIITNSNISSYTLINNTDIKFQYLDLDLNSELFNKYENIKKYGL